MAAKIRHISNIYLTHVRHFVFPGLGTGMIETIGVVWHYYAVGLTLERIPLYMGIALNSGEVLQRLVSVTLNILIYLLAY